MYTLYIDTHFINTELVVFKDDTLFCKKVCETNEQTKTTIPMLESLLQENKLTLKNLSEIIVVTGPGSFTGSRIGVVIAKMLSYTLNIPVKEITYLEAMALNFDNEVTVGIKDRNGVFIGKFDKLHNLIEDYYYLSNSEIDNSSLNIIYDTKIDFEKVKKYLNRKEPTKTHLLKPLYVKKIEVEKC